MNNSHYCHSLKNENAGLRSCKPVEKLHRKYKTNRFSQFASFLFTVPRGVRGPSGGFSLIEVAMALGIFGFAIIPIIGLMGTAQVVCQDSIQASSRARIFEQITPLLSTTTDILGSGTSYYFTVTGQKTEPNGTGNLAPVFTSTCVDVSGSLNNTSMFPNNAVAGLTATKVIKVYIQHYLQASPNTTSTMGTTFVVFSKDPKDLL